jgi:hypothetical protein
MSIESNAAYYLRIWSKLKKLNVNTDRIATELRFNTWGNPADWNGDTEFGICDLSGKEGMLEPMCCLNHLGEIEEVEVLAEIAYLLHGLAGAY